MLTPGGHRVAAIPEIPSHFTHRCRGAGLNFNHENNAQTGTEKSQTPPAKTRWRTQTRRQQRALITSLIIRRIGWWLI